MSKVIINADDCGRSIEDDIAIESAILKGVITSTTVMANLYDLDGAVNLFNKYNSQVSFGAHLNLSEGKPLTAVKPLLDCGFCTEENGEIEFGFLNDFNSRGAVKAKLKFQYMPLNNEAKKCIYYELEAQIQKLLDSGIKISHIDSHNHMHMSPSILPIVCQLAKEYGITTMRHGINQNGYSLKSIFFRMINAYDATVMRNMKQTDVFCSVNHFERMVKNDHRTYEVMCHPGITFGHYPAEMKWLACNISKIREEYQLITYRDI